MAEIVTSPPEETEQPSVTDAVESSTTACVPGCLAGALIDVAVEHRMTLRRELRSSDVSETTRREILDSVETDFDGINSLAGARAMCENSVEGCDVMRWTDRYGETFGPAIQEMFRQIEVLIEPRDGAA